jgi:hypothetical protein
MIFVTYIHEYGDLNRGEIIKPVSNLVPYDAFLEEPSPGTPKILSRLAKISILE